MARVDTRTLEERVAAWELELAEAEKNLKNIRIKTDEEFLAGFVAPEIEMVDDDEQITVFDMGDAVAKLKALGVKEEDFSDWELNYDSEDVFMSRYTQRQETADEYEKRVGDLKLQYIAEAKKKDPDYINRRQNVNGLNKKIKSLKERLKQCKPRVVNTKSKAKVLIYSYYGDHEIIAPYKHNVAIEGDAMKIAEEFISKGLRVQISSAEVEDGQGFIIMVSGSNFHQK